MLIAAAMALSPGAARGQDAAHPVAPARPFLTRADAWFGAAAAAGIAAAGLADRELRDRGRLAGGAPARRLADFVRPLGTPAVLAPAIALAAAAGWGLGRPDVTSASLRVAVGVGVSALACEGLKIAVGRERPSPAGGDSDEFRPFSGHDSFPSGHTTVAFAAAAGVDRETAAAWVPWAVYPLAGLVGWSRVHDDRHWTSDVVAGAALGIWAAGKTEDWMRRRRESPRRFEAQVSGGRHSIGLTLHWTY